MSSLNQSVVRFAVLTLPLLIWASNLAAQEPPLPSIPNDFDGDGISDLLAVNRGGSLLAWKSTPSSKDPDAAPIDVEFGASTDVAIPGYWTDDQMPTLGRVRVDVANDALRWAALKPASIELTPERVLGKPGDLILSGADFNGDGVGDAAVSRRIDDIWQWEVMTSPMSGGRNRVYRFELGRAGDRLSFVNLLGAGDWACAFGKDPRARRSRLALRNVRTGRQRTYKKFPLALSRAPRPRPIPIKDEFGADFIAFVIPKETDTTVQTFTVRGKRIHSVTVQGVGSPLVGDFIEESPGEELAIYTSSQLRIINPFFKTTAIRNNVSGELVDQFSVVETKLASTPTPSPTGAPGGELRTVP